MADATGAAAADTAAASGAAGAFTAGGDKRFDRENADIGAEEAHAGAVLDQTRSWNANTKACFDTLQEELHSAVKEANAHISELRTVRLQMLSTMAVNSDNVQKQHLAHRDIATDRTWTQSNELETILSAKSGVQADAMVTLLAKAIADALTKGV